MGRKSRERRRERDQRAREEAVTTNESPPVLRLVRSEQESLPVEQDAAGRTDQAIQVIRDITRDVESDRTSALASHVDSAVAERAIVDRIPISLVRRSVDATEINAIFNDPSVFEQVAIPGADPLDVSPLLDNPQNIFLITEGGAISFAWHDVHSYQVHTGFIRGFRGSHAIRASRAAYRWMFTQTDCVELLTLVPGNNPAAAMFCRLVGATHEFDRKGVWPGKDGPVDMGFWSLRYDDWLRKTPELVLSGQKFHNRLTAEFLRFDKTEKQHPDEDCHDLHVGACFEMMHGGQIEKAVFLYNRWAKFSGYGQIALISREPAVIDIGNALLQVTDDIFKVVLVK